MAGSIVQGSRSRVNSAQLAKRGKKGAQAEKRSRGTGRHLTAERELLRLKEEGIAFIDDPLFALPQAVQWLIQPAEETSPEGSTSPRRAGRKPRPVVEQEGYQAGQPRSPLVGYFESLAEFRVLTREQEAFWFRKMNYLRYQAHLLLAEDDQFPSPAPTLRAVRELLESSDRVRNLLLRANLRLVVSVAKRFANQGVGFEELVSEGNIALLRAVEKFDAGRGFKFSTYATRSIRNALALVVNQHRVQSHRFMTGSEVILEDRVTMEDAWDELPVRMQQMHNVLPRLMGGLDETSRTVVSARFGWESDGEAQTLEEIGRKLGLSRERVRQIQLRAIRKMKERVESECPELAELV